MELAAGALAAVGSAVSGAATAAGSALGLGVGAPMSLAPVAAGAAGTAGLGSTLLSVGQGALGLVGAMGAMRTGQAQAQALTEQATDARLQATQTDIDETNKDTSLRKALISAIGQRDTAYAASGVDPSFGTPVAVRNQAMSDATNAMQQDDDAEGVQRDQYEARAENDDAMASDDETAAWLKALGSIGVAGLGIAARG